ncbi:MAG: hypothetical protein QM528_02360, partial [Phycisphaerales bacterium]|nr:hypothetical protein [Phycisphaerales bacterium]
MMRLTFIRIIVLVSFYSIPLLINAQVNIGVDVPIDNSAILQLTATNKGLLLPSMTSTQRDAIPMPATGLMIFNTTRKTLDINIGTPATPNWSIASIPTIITNANNGLTINAGTLQLGGTLIQATNIQTSTTNTLSISGLQSSISLSDSFLVSSAGTGILRLKSLKSLNVVDTATNGLTKNKDTVVLGGILDRPTTIETSTATPLMITNLNLGVIDADTFLLTEDINGLIRKLKISSLVTSSGWGLT